MANQQNQPRPWFRLPSITRPGPPPPAQPPPPKPRTAILPPALSQRFATPPPPPPPPAVSPPLAAVARPSPPPPATASPKKSPTSTPPPPPALPLMPSPAALSPKKSPTSPPSPPPSPAPARSTSTATSPLTKLLTPPPSPTQFKSIVERQTKPPPESEQKTVLVQESTGKTQVERDIKTRENKNHKNNLWNSEAFGARIITVAGEERGAIMELRHSRNKDEFNGEKPKIEDHKSINSLTEPFKGFVNSNVQGVNNSILYNRSSTLHDPGVHLSIYKKAGGGVEIKERKNRQEI